ncbi:hypothetical protein QY481_02440 (plasmid) [Klebsiella pneumoniae]|nr:hypothetical protein QY481_02440 [Klebsiella pneumoniae]
MIGEAARDRACASGTAKLAQPHVEASLPVCRNMIHIGEEGAQKTDTSNLQGNAQTVALLQS